MNQLRAERPQRSTFHVPQHQLSHHAAIIGSNKNIWSVCGEPRYDMSHALMIFGWKRMVGDGEIGEVVSGTGWRQ